MIDPAETRVLDINAEALGVPPGRLMENAGRAVASMIMEAYPDAPRILVVCGTGNNGGDGAVAARYLADAGRQVTLALVRPRARVRSELLKENLLRLPASVRVVEAPGPEIVGEADLVVDAMLGTGLRAGPGEPYAAWIDTINRAGASGVPVVSVDMPSGLGSDRVVRPHMTVALHDSKSGMTPENSGDIRIADIGIPEEASRFVGPGEICLYPVPARDSHKGQNGRLLIIGGGPYFGAPALAGFGAHRIGADLVTIASPASSASVIAGYSPNFIVRVLPGGHLAPGHLELLAPMIEDADAVLVGPGLGREPETIEAVRGLLAGMDRPVVVDADGLFALASGGAFPIDAPSVLTPHGREFSRLAAGEKPGEEAARRLAERLESTILLKGPEDIITDGARLKRNRTGNPGMTVGGTGDVLAGIVGGLLAKGVSPYDAARMGAYISGLAGDLAFGELGYSMTATDVVSGIPGALKEALALMHQSP